MSKFKVKKVKKPLQMVLKKQLNILKILRTKTSRNNQLCKGRRVLFSVSILLLDSRSNVGRASKRTYSKRKLKHFNNSQSLFLCLLLSLKSYGQHYHQFYVSQSNINTQHSQFHIQISIIPNT